MTARQLEAGDTDLTGRLGAGAGAWRLKVSSNRPLKVVNIAASGAGYWNNLSTTAVAGAAPVNQAGWNRRFVGRSEVNETVAGRFTRDVMDGGRFTASGKSDGVASTRAGSYSYAAIGPDAGRITLEYDDGDRCRANYYFSSRTSGWIASHCTGGDDTGGYWTGGRWTAEAGTGDGSGEAVGATYGVNDALPGVPVSGTFVPNATSVGSTIANTTDGTTITLSEHAYFELGNGTRYTCASAGGCTVLNGTVARGTLTGRTSGSGDGEVDRFPTFRTAAPP